MAPNHRNTGADDRSRDEDGTIGRKRSDTLVRTLRHEYGDSFARGFRSDANLATVLRQTGTVSLSKLLGNSQSREQRTENRRLRMPRKTFFSFHYKPDCSRAAQVRNMGMVDGNVPVSDNDWESVTRGGEDAIKRWIAGQLEGRSCTVVLVGQNTAVYWRGEGRL